MISPRIRWLAAAVLFCATALRGQCQLQYVGGSIDGQIRDAATLPDGDVVVVGTFTVIDGVPCAHIARFDGAAWHPYGSGFDSPPAKLVAMANGELVVGGNFTVVDGVVADGLASWNGSSWSAHPQAWGSVGDRWTVLPDGRLVRAVGGTWSPTGGLTPLEIQRWDGAAWTTIGTASGISQDSAPFHTFVYLDVLPTGELLAVGDWFAVDPIGDPGPGGYKEAMVFNGQSWDHFRQAYLCTGVEIDPLGGVFLLFSNSITHWDGESFATLLGYGLGLQSTRSVARVPDGDVIVGGNGGPWLPWEPQNHYLPLSRWHGDTGGFLTGDSASLGFDPGYVAPGPNHNDVAFVAFHQSGKVIVQGSFDDAGGVAANDLAYLQATCSAGVQLTPTACSPAGGPLQLTLPRRAWTGGNVRAQTCGFAPASWCVHVLGFAPANASFVGVLPQGIAGCDLLASPDILALEVPQAGVATVDYDLPADAALVGLPLHHQSLQMGFDAAGDFVSLTTSNGLVATVGAF